MGWWQLWLGPRGPRVNVTGQKAALLLQKLLEDTADGLRGAGWDTAAGTGSAPPQSSQSC